MNAHTHTHAPAHAPAHANTPHAAHAHALRAPLRSAHASVEIQHLADLIALPLARVEHKLSQMILDKKLNGILDQGRGQLILREELETSKSFTEGLAVIKNMNSVADSLFVRTQNLRI